MGVPDANHDQPAQVARPDDLIDLLAPVLVQTAEHGHHDNIVFPGSLDDLVGLMNGGGQHLIDIDMLFMLGGPDTDLHMLGGFAHHHHAVDILPGQNLFQIRLKGDAQAVRPFLAPLDVIIPGHCHFDLRIGLYRTVNAQPGELDFLVGAGVAVPKA